VRLFRHAQPGIGIETDRQRSAPASPFDHRAFDQAGMRLHQVLCTSLVLRLRLRLCVELAPGGSPAVEKGINPESLYPALQAVLRDTLFLEIMKRVVKALGRQPGTAFFDGVAIGNSVQGDHQPIVEQYLHYIGILPNKFKGF
jgi:hypothetical protein